MDKQDLLKLANRAEDSAESISEFLKFCNTLDFEMGDIQELIYAVEEYCEECPITQHYSTKPIDLNAAKEALEMAVNYCDDDYVTHKIEVAYNALFGKLKPSNTEQNREVSMYCNDNEVIIEKALEYIDIFKHVSLDPYDLENILEGDFTSLINNCEKYSCNYASDDCDDCMECEYNPVWKPDNNSVKIKVTKPAEQINKIVDSAIAHVNSLDKNEFEYLHKTMYEIRACIDNNDDKLKLIDRINQALLITINGISISGKKDVFHLEEIKKSLNKLFEIFK